MFGLLIIELVKIIETNAPPKSFTSFQNIENIGLLWTGVFQGGLLIIGLGFLIGRVEVVLRGIRRSLKFFRLMIGL